MKTSSTTLACLAAMSLTIGYTHAAPCQDGGGTGAWVYDGPLTPGFTDRLVLRCAPQAVAGNYSGTAQYVGGPDNVTLGLSASAYGEPGRVHASARSQVLSGGRSEDLLSAYPAAAVAHAATSLVFTLNAPVGTPAHVLAPIEFDIRGTGQMGGEHGFFAGSGAYSLLFPSNGIRWRDTGYYQDSTGVVRDSGYRSGSWDGPAKQVEFGIDLTGMFEAGQNYFQVLLDVTAIGNAFADFSHTAAIAGLHVADGYSLTLPEGLFTVDPGDPGHYIAAAASSSAEVPEPSTWVMTVLGLAALAIRRRRD